MENRNLPSNRRSARQELTERVEGLAQEILDHLASNNLASSAPARGRNSQRARVARGGRSVSFSNICACPGPNCTSRPPASHPPAYSELNPQAHTFTPAARETSRNTARRSRPNRAAPSNLCRPRLTAHTHRSGFQETEVVDTGAATSLWPPSAFATEEDQTPEKRSDSFSPASPPASPGPPPLAPRTPPSSPPAVPRGPSPVLEPDTSHIGRRAIDLGFRVYIASHLDHTTAGVEKSYENSCSCQQT